jgi:hypothetical protein
MEDPMRSVRYVVPALIALFASATLAFAAFNQSHAHLSGANEVPPVDTHGQGQATFKLSEDGTQLEYELNAANLSSPILQAHIHLGPAGENGPVVAFLFGPVPAPGVVNNGRLSSGTIEANDLIGPLAGQPLSELVEAIEAGNTYVNVHTDQNGGGEVRGQILVPHIQ